MGGSLGNPCLVRDQMKIRLNLVTDLVKMCICYIYVCMWYVCMPVYFFLTVYVYTSMNVSSNIHFLDTFADLGNTLVQTLVGRGHRHRIKSRELAEGTYGRY